MSPSQHDTTPLQVRRLHPALPGQHKTPGRYHAGEVTLRAASLATPPNEKKKQLSSTSRRVVGWSAMPQASTASVDHNCLISGMPARAVPLPPAAGMHTRARAESTVQRRLQEKNLLSRSCWHYRPCNTWERDIHSRVLFNTSIDATVDDDSQIYMYARVWKCRCEIVRA